MSGAPVTRGRARAAGLLPWVLAGLTILVQISWILVSGRQRDLLTITAVVLFCLASATHALATRGWRWASVFFGVVLAFGLAIEAVGVATGLPFGSYAYGDRLGPALLGVPLLIPLAWAMMAYPCFVVAARAMRTRAAAIVLAGTLLAAWDLFLDPQMVAEGHWDFTSPTPALPGSTGTPLVNHIGWLVAGLALMTCASLALDAILGRAPGDAGAALPSAAQPSIALPAGMLAWVYGSNVLANAVFLGRPAVAIVGSIGMGIPMAIAAAGLRQRREDAHA